MGKPVWKKIKWTQVCSTRFLARIFCSVFHRCSSKCTNVCVCVSEPKKCKFIIEYYHCHFVFIFHRFSSSTTTFSSSSFLQHCSIIYWIQCNLFLLLWILRCLSLKQSENKIITEYRIRLNGGILIFIFK